MHTGGYSPHIAAFAILLSMQQIAADRSNQNMRERESKDDIEIAYCRYHEPIIVSATTRDPLVSLLRRMSVGPEDQRHEAHSCLSRGAGTS